jgi:6-phosphogluconolactonase (cycloisomerase 2 family)
VSGYSVGTDGTLTLLNADGKTGITAPGSVDEAISGNGRYLYVLNGSGSISAFAINANGSLDKLADVPVTVNSNGLVSQ